MQTSVSLVRCRVKSVIFMRLSY